MTAIESEPSASPRAPGADARAEPRFVDALSRLVLDAFFRSVEVEGVERVPRRGPVVFVANHANGLVDPALLMAFLPRRPRFLAKSTLWKIAPLRPILGWAAAIPVYRQQDRGVDRSKNADSLRRCREVLRAGGAVALFPEGRAHDDPALGMLKTGVARIVLEAEREAAASGERLGIAIVPVGLSFDDKTRFRSRALVEIGNPFDATPELALAKADDRQAVRVLTERIREALVGVTVNYPSWREARWIDRAADIYARPDTGAPSARRLRHVMPLRRGFAAGYETMRARRPNEVAAVVEAVREYDRGLEFFGLTDAQVRSRYTPSAVGRFVAGALWRLVVLLPAGILGTVLHAPTYWLIDGVSKIFGREPVVRATFKALPAIVLYPLTWLVASFLAWWAVGKRAALATLTLAPIAGYAAVKLQQSLDVIRSQTRAFVLATSGVRGIRELKRRRREVADQVEALVTAWRELDDR
ncbi:MAG: lysophospholipid acyltransferase family protein [Acidobacteriota bacterium]